MRWDEIVTFSRLYCAVVGPRLLPWSLWGAWFPYLAYTMMMMSFCLFMMMVRVKGGKSAREDGVVAIVLET